MILPIIWRFRIVLRESIKRDIEMALRFAPTSTETSRGNTATYTADVDGTAEGVTQTHFINADMYDTNEDLHSGPFISTDSGIPADLLQLTHSFGYDCQRRNNLQLLDEQTLVFIAGNWLILLDVQTKEQRYLRSCSGGGIGAIAAHPSGRYFAVAEKGDQPKIIIYEFPSLHPYFVLGGGTEKAFSAVNFNHDGTLLASVGSSPDFRLTLWDLIKKQIMHQCKAFSQDVYRVTFSPYDPCRLTTSGSGHINFWKTASTLTGTKLSSLLGKFGKTALTDIDSYLELPGGKVVSSSKWGNMLLWEGDLIMVEICRKNGQPCHAGAIQQFALDESDLITVGIDGVIRIWDVESIEAAVSPDDEGRFEMKPINELIVGHNIRLTSMVKSALSDSSIWFAQDASGSIMKLDLSFSNLSNDPECLFTFHAGAIQSMDISTTSHLMATTALDRSVRIYDFLAKTELTASQHNRGGTALIWAPSSISPHRTLLVVGFEDGVIRLLELGLQADLDQSQAKEGKLCLRQALKPHNAPVTAMAYDRNGEVLATGSADRTVFLFTVGNKYEPIGFVNVPGPVKSLEWSPKGHEKNTLLILCCNGHVVELDASEAKSHIPTTTFEIQGLLSRHFHFRSIKSRIKRDIEVAQREEEREKRRKEKEQMKKPSTEDEDEEQEEEEEEGDVPTVLYIPESPSPMLCAFYSQPGAFWLSVGGYDAGFLYHCRFSEQQEGDPELRQDEPFAFVPLQDTEEDPVCTLSFSPSRQFFLCGMRSGHIRVYPLPQKEPVVASLDAFWALSVHDNQNGRLSSVGWSYDERFVVTAGEDGNIFVFSFHPPEDQSEAWKPSHAKIPSPLVAVADDKSVRDTLDTRAYSIETAKQRAELDRKRHEAENRKDDRRRKLAKLQSQLSKVLVANQRMPEHIHLQPMELELDPRFREEAEKRTAEQSQEVQKELAWEAERHRVGLKKLQDRFWDSLQSDVISVVACQSEFKISTYRLLPPSERFLQQLRDGQLAGSQRDQMDLSTEDDRAKGRRLKTEKQDETGGKSAQPWWKAGHMTYAQQKAVEKAKKMKAKIDRRKQEWVEFLASKPDEGDEDPEDVRAVELAKENVGDYKLKTAKDFTVPEQLRINADRKASQLVALEEEIHERKLKMNEGILALREAKIQLISQLGRWMEQLLAVQAQLAPELRRERPLLPTLRPEEAPERRLLYTPQTLQRFAALRSRRKQGDVMEGEPEEPSVLSLMGEDSIDLPQTSPALSGESAPSEAKPCKRTQLEEEEAEGQNIRLLNQQDCLLSQMDKGMGSFDADLRILRHKKMVLDAQMKIADLRHITLFQEHCLLKDMEKRENSLQDRLSARMQEKRHILAKLTDYKKQLKAGQQNLADLQEREEALHASFQASLGEDDRVVGFLSRVFKKKIKRVKEKTGDEEEEGDSTEESEEESDWDDMESDEELENSPLDDSVCPPFCDRDLFENTLQLREEKADLEDLIAEEKKTCDALKKDCDALAKKVKIVQHNLQAAERDIELFEREKQQKLNELDMVVPLRLHQVNFLTDEMLPNDLSDSLVLNTATQLSLQDRIQQLKQEKSDEEERYRQAKRHHKQLINDRKEMETRIQDSEKHCEDAIISKFGRLVNLEALQTLSENKTKEELQFESRKKEVEHEHALNDLKVKVMEVKRVLANKERRHTTLLHSLASLIEETRKIDQDLNPDETKQQPSRSQFSVKHWEQEERPRLKKSIAARKEEIAALKLEIAALSKKGGIPHTRSLT